jgi:hypothetical protein
MRAFLWATGNKVLPAHHIGYADMSAVESSLAPSAPCALTRGLDQLFCDN